MRHREKVNGPVNRLEVRLLVEYDGEINPEELVEYLEGGLNAYVGTAYSKIQFQNHAIEYEVQDANS